LAKTVTKEENRHDPLEVVGVADIKGLADLWQGRQHGVNAQCRHRHKA